MTPEQQNEHNTETLALRQTDAEDYSAVLKLKDGNKRYAGRIFKTWGPNSRGRIWMWTVEYLQRSTREAPHQGYADTLDEAKAAFRRCWDSKKSTKGWIQEASSPDRKAPVQ